MVVFLFGFFKILFLHFLLIRLFSLICLLLRFSTSHYVLSITVISIRVIISLQVQYLFFITLGFKNYFHLYIVILYILALHSKPPLVL